MSDEADAEATIEDLKAQVSNDTGVPAEVLRGEGLEDIQAHAESLKALLPPPPPAAGYVPSEGRIVGNGGSSPSTAFAAFLNEKLGYTR